MTERSRNVVVGITALSGLVGLAVLLLLFGYLPAFVEQGYHMRVVLKNAGGLATGSRVYLDGIPVGRVTRIIHHIGTREGPILVTIIIHPTVDIPRGATVSVEQLQILGGAASLAFDTSAINPEAPDYARLVAPWPKDGSAEVAGQVQTVMSQFSANLKSVFPTQSFEELAKSAQQLTQEWTEVGKNLRLLTNPATPAEVDAGKAGPNLASVLARADARLRQLQVTIDGLNKWVNDTQLREDIRKTAANASVLTGRLNTTAQKADQLIDSARTDVDQLTKRYLAVADDLSATVTSARKTLEEARSGKGTLGKLMSDPALYDNLNDSIIRLGQALDQVRLLIEKIKTEGLPVH